MSKAYQAQLKKLRKRVRTLVILMFVIAACAVFVFGMDAELVALICAGVLFATFVAITVGGLWSD